LKIKTVDLSGNRIDIKSAAIESFGKAFLLPIDVILGWIFTNNKRQRIFNRISNTIVIKLKLQLTSEDIRYTKRLGYENRIDTHHFILFTLLCSNYGVYVVLVPVNYI
jgi:hypothetical protein